MPKGTPCREHGNLDGPCPTCKRQAERRWRRKKYQHLLDKQDGKCGICKKPLEFPSKDAHVDHDHKTGRIRGILCLKCNFLLGHLENHIDNFARLAEIYLNS